MLYNSVSSFFFQREGEGHALASPLAQLLIIYIAGFLITSTVLSAIVYDTDMSREDEFITVVMVSLLAMLWPIVVPAVLGIHLGKLIRRKR